MPIYEFICKKCDKKFETLVRSSASKVECPHCGSEELKIFSPPLPPKWIPPLPPPVPMQIYVLLPVPTPADAAAGAVITIDINREKNYDPVPASCLAEKTRCRPQ